MRFTILPAVLILSVAGASLALASTTTQGVIKTLDLMAHSITLADGSTFTLPQTFKDPGLKVGEKVAIVWDMKGVTHEASAVTVVK